MPRGVKNPPPSKEEVKAARKQASAAQKVLAAHHRAKRKRRGKVLRTRSPVERDFYTWQHDFETLLKRAEGRTAQEVVAFAEAGADRMAQVVASRDPLSENRLEHPRYRRGIGARREWHNWQERFDNLLHTMVNFSTLNEKEIISRAEAIADLAAPAIERRRPKRKSK